MLVFGVHSFLDHYLKVGIQYIAEGFAANGWLVDYVSIFSSPVDIVGFQRRKRLRRVWINSQDMHGIAINERLTEYAFKAIFPAHKELFRYGWQMGTYSAMAPSWCKKKRYHVCICDVTPNVVYCPTVKADFNILRLNDLPEGFSHRLSRHIIDLIQKNIRSNLYDEIWAAHEPLTRYALEQNPENRVVTIHNGVDDNYSSMKKTVAPKKRSAVFIGCVDQRIDLALLDKTAERLPDWQIDVIGPLKRSWPVRARNVRLLSPVSREKAPEVLARYQVGLIPFREGYAGVQCVEMPLKFLEYIGAGLGVASTDVGSLRSGMGDWASYGNTPDRLAEAIRKEAERDFERTAEMRHHIVQESAWSRVIKTMIRRIDNLMIQKMGEHEDSFRQ